MHVARVMTGRPGPGHAGIQDTKHANTSPCPAHVPTCSIYFEDMGSNMEGNWQLLQQAGAEKPIVARGTPAGFKRTFRLHNVAGKGLLSDAASADEALLEQSSAEYTGMKLMRGLWTEQTGDSSGTFFPVAAPAGRGVLWGSAGHCLIPSSQWNWRCGYGTEVLHSGPSSQPLVRAVVDLGWLTAGCDVSELAEHIPSQPTQGMEDAEVMPDFGFMVTEALEETPSRIFIPSPRQLRVGDPVCVLGFAHRPTATWARTYLRTEADYEQAARKAELLGHAPPPPVGWRLDENVALRRALDLQDDVCYPSRLVASPGLVAGASGRIVEHTCSTFPGMSGGPGVDVQRPWQLLFVHTRADTDYRRNNYGYSVHHPLFVKAYEREVLPRLMDTPPDLLSAEMLRCLHGYLSANRDQLADQRILHQVEQRC